jgi:serine/threonine protein kinase/dipeptidyl aminopeptidase/acylaminoacyl peptidase
MTDEEWRLAWKLYSKTVDLAEDERRSVLAPYEIEPELLDEVISMLEEAQTNLDAPLPKPGSRAGAGFGRYEIGELLSSGGMGEVYEADDPELSRKVAVKFLSPELAASGRAVERLMREARAASALNHPHIITVYEIIRMKDDVAIAMELVEGHSLRHFCDKPQDIEKIILCGRQIAQALAAAHQRNIIQRDIKPENLMVRDDAILKVLDFGIAGQPHSEHKRSSGQSSGSGGTLNYMSPEQARGEQATGATDVFSLGLVLYELGTGTHPFRSASPIDTLRAITHAEPKPPSSLNRKIPAKLETLLLRMLSKDPASRPTALESERQLTLAGFIKPGRRSRSIAWATAAISVIAISGALTRSFHDRRVSQKDPRFLQLTRQVNENRVIAAAISNDGKTLLFVTFAGPVYRRRMSDGLTQPLDTPSGLRVDRIAWFNDGSKILVEGSMTGALDKYEPGIWVMPAEGGRAEQVAAGARNGVPSPDGSRIAFTSTDGSVLSVASITSGNRRQIRSGGETTSFTSLVWSPDGKRIAFQQIGYVPTANVDRNPGAFLALNTYRHDYKSVDVESGRPVVSANGFIMESPCGLNDGTVLFLRNSTENMSIYHLWRLRTDPHTGRFLSPPQQLTHEEYYLKQISATPDGRELVAVRGVDSHPNIYVAALPPADQYPRFITVRRFTFTDADEYPHAWTPDSRSIIFESYRNGNFDLFRQGIDQSDAQPLVISNQPKALARVSPDRKWILYNEKNHMGRWDLMRIPIGGGTPKTLLLNQGLQGEFACSSATAGRCVGRTLQNQQFLFWDLNAVLGKGRQLARTAWIPATVGDWDISPDGSQVAIPNHDPRNATIRLVPLDAHAGTAEKVVTIKTLKNLSGVVWAPNGRGWYVAVGGVNRGLLFYVDLEGRVLTKLMESMAATYAVPSPDGRHVAFMDWTVSANVWQVSVP